MVNPLRYSVMSILGLALMLGATDAALADDDCDFTKTCPIDTYKVTFLQSSSRCPPQGGLGSACRFFWEPPYPAALNCEYNYSGYVCEAWPQGDTLRYAYSATGSISLPYPIPSDVAFAGVACWTSGAGTLTVTITSTSAPGLSSVVSSSLYCP